MKLNNKSSQKLSVWAKGGLTIVISVLIVSVVVKAGSLTPTASPAATSYTLTDIYNRLDTNAVATEEDHDFAPGASPAGTLYTLTQIYDKIPTIAANTVGVGNTYCGIDGTLLANLDNGSAGANVADFAFYTQAKGGVDDYNNNGDLPNDSYTSTWTTCVAENNYCETNGDTNADKKDDSTGLIWSIWLDSGATHTWFWANNCYEPETAENSGTCVADGNDACRCVKKESGEEVGCEVLGDEWRLPSQKELLQAYIDGSWGGLSSDVVYWSATTTSGYTQDAWYTSLGNGATSNFGKTNSLKVRCVR
ncbi:MAG: DUF1566 domain-containing protein [Patescibacteria group bacterium]|nr:DUF1566 domain-containing protein [Patescibacteria group bacterium]